jgi:hypothetical protein
MQAAGADRFGLGLTSRSDWRALRTILFILRLSSNGFESDYRLLVPRPTAVARAAAESTGS